ncbi:unnamed protein product [Ectocarpus sp. 12 AP-2014]
MQSSSMESRNSSAVEWMAAFSGVWVSYQSTGGSAARLEWSTIAPRDRMMQMLAIQPKQYNRVAGGYKPSCYPEREISGTLTTWGKLMLRVGHGGSKVCLTLFHLLCLSPMMRRDC